MFSYNCWTQNPQMEPSYQSSYQPVTQSPVYFQDMTNNQYVSLNGQLFAMLPMSNLTIPSPVTSDSSFSSGYGSEVSPNPVYQTNPYSVSSEWYQQPQVKKEKTNPDSEGVIRQIFQTQSSKQTKWKKKIVKKSNPQITTTSKKPTIKITTESSDQDNIDDSDLENDEDDTSLEEEQTKKQRLRTIANERERKRKAILNEAFENLIQVLPQKTGRKRRKISRIDSLYIAAKYIAYMNNMLTNTTGPIELNFDHLTS